MLNNGFFQQTLATCLLLQAGLAINREVVACVSNQALITPDGKFGMLRMWIDGMQRAKVKNYMVIAIDDEVGGSPPPPPGSPIAMPPLSTPFPLSRSPLSFNV